MFEMYTYDHSTVIDSYEFNMELDNNIPMR